MLIDITTVLILIAGLVKGYRSGLIHSLFYVIGLVLGTALALRFGYVASGYLRQSFNIDSAYLPILSFAVVFILILAGMLLLAKLIENLLKATQLNFLNRLGGAVVWTFTGIFLLSTAVWYLSKSNIITEQARADSRAWPYIEPVSPTVIQGASVVLPFLKDIYHKIEQQIENKTPSDNNAS